MVIPKGHYMVKSLYTPDRHIYYMAKTMLTLPPLNIEFRCFHWRVEMSEPMKSLVSYGSAKLFKYSQASEILKSYWSQWKKHQMMQSCLGKILAILLMRWLGQKTATSTRHTKIEGWDLVALEVKLRVHRQQQEQIKGRTCLKAVFGPFANPSSKNYIEIWIQIWP